ncbi:hypothetical protein CDL15_Pgr023282 [Punica granatum]|uniref:Uncharacterized protein n=1 Tax=Punica granatum TaxID=22663 RepID=A0A218WJ68_PUNGR|nr:hypothetical protein CDL15_Pgr023282 [Punica granatum]
MPSGASVATSDPTCASRVCPIFQPGLFDAIRVCSTENSSKPTHQRSNPTLEGPIPHLGTSWSSRVTSVRHRASPSATLERHQRPSPSVTERNPRASPASVTERHRAQPSSVTSVRHRASPSATLERHQRPSPSVTERNPRASPASVTERHRAQPSSVTSVRHRASPSATLERHQRPSPSVTERNPRASPASVTERHRAQPSSVTSVRHRASPSATLERHQRPSPSVTSTPAPVTSARPRPSPAHARARHQRTSVPTSSRHRARPCPCTSILAPEYPFKGSTESPDSQTLPRLFPRIPRLEIRPSRPIEIKEYKHRRGLGFRPSCHEIIEARRGNHLHRLTAHYGRLNRGTPVPPLSHFFPGPSHTIGGTLDGLSSDSDDTPTAPSAVYAVTKEIPLGVHIRLAQENEELNNWTSVPRYSAVIADV